MAKLDEVFKTVDSKLLENTDFQKALKEAVDDLVLEKAELKATELFEARENEYIKAIDEQMKVVAQTIEVEQAEKFNEAVDSKVKEITEAYAEEVKKEAEEKMNEEVTALQEKVLTYVEYAVKEFVQEAAPTWDKELDVAKANKIQESFVEMANKFGVELSNISADEKLKEVNETLENSIKMGKELQKQIDEMKKEKIIDESVKDLSAPQTDKLLKLLESIDYVDETSYKTKVEMFKSALSDSKKSDLKESKTADGYVPSWKRNK